MTLGIGAGTPELFPEFPELQQQQKSGRLIAFDGIDGTGKGTLIQLLASYLLAAGVQNYLVTRQPGGSTLGDRIRDILFKDPGTHDIDNDALECLFLANHIHNTNRVIRPALREGVHVIADRHWPSAVAYMDERGADARLRGVYHEFRGPRHDLLFLLVGDPSVTTARAAARGGGEGVDGKQAQKKWASAEKLANVQRSFIVNFGSDPRTIVVDTTTRCAEDLAENVIAPAVFTLLGVVKPSFEEVFHAKR